MSTKFIFLFGHRQQHGKNASVDFAEDILIKQGKTVHTQYFAQLLKKQVSEKYGLDFSKMEDNSYKQYCPPWINPKVKYFDADGEEVSEKFYKNNLAAGFKKIEEPRTVRDILIEEGCKAREIWSDTWADHVYRDILDSDADIGLVSDFRFPNEFNCFNESFSRYKEKHDFMMKPQVIRVLVNKPDGPFKNDGADAELPDDPNYWDYVIENDGSLEDLEEKVKTLLIDYNILS